MAIDVRPKRFTVEEYERMGEAGILPERPRLELIGGEIIEMNPIGIRHAAVVKWLIRLLARQLRDTAMLSVQDPLVVDDRSEPQPDVMVLRLRPDGYYSAHPRVADVLLLIEVADSTLAYDTSIKLPLYARNGVVETWIVDLIHDVIQVHTEPSPEGYRSVRVARAAETLVPRMLPEVSIRVADVLKGPV